ncbi:hypothetical protein DV735_g4917, partial [Chaetothyriales sp. CBS 134920]
MVLPLSYLGQVMSCVLVHDANDEILKCQCSPDLAQRYNGLLELADEKIHVFPFSDVKPCWFRLYTDASIVKAVKILEEYWDLGRPGLLIEAVAALDMALLMAGGLGREELIQDMLTNLQVHMETDADTAETDSQAKRRRLAAEWTNGKDEQHLPAEADSRAKRRRLAAEWTKSKDEQLLPAEAVSMPKISCPVPAIAAPSLEDFHKHLHDRREPVILRGAFNHWPALHKWKKVSFWENATLAGSRLVPVELGRSYVDSDWGQEILPFKRFLHEYILDSSRRDSRTGYLAQHDLFKQIPALYADITTPDYCYLDAPPPDAGTPVALTKSAKTQQLSHPSTLPQPVGQSSNPEVQSNIWFGPAWTISPLHHDPYHNILCQVVGKKYLRLYSPHYSSRLQPMSNMVSAPHLTEAKGDLTIDMSNTSSIDVAAMEVSPHEDWDSTYPNISEVPYIECVLEAGQALYIPIGWWHYQQSYRVAIIGGGAAGSSAAYHLRKFANESAVDAPIEIALFEASARIGGRTTTVDVFGDDSLPIELGASIFVKANPILYNATLDFGLDIKGFAEKKIESDFEWGIWDGTNFVFKQAASESRWLGYWDVIKLIWKYGISPIKVQRLTQAMVGRFLQLYEEPVFPFKVLQEAVAETELMPFMALTGLELMREKGVSDSFANDIIQASTRVNYAQNMAQIHGLESLVCMATDGAMAVEGGNWQIFDQMTKRADLTVHHSSLVTAVVRDQDSGKYALQVDGDKGAGANIQRDGFDTVILAAPYQFANLSFSPVLLSPPERIEYVSLHVTLFTSPYSLSPTFFDLDEQSQVPSSVFTTLPLGSSGEDDQHKFFSVSTLRTIPPGKHSDKPQYVYKIFSSHRLTASFLAELYGFPFYQPGEASAEAGIDSVGKEYISWYYEKVWHSYPYEIPRTTFADIKLTNDASSPSGIWYTSGIESFISTMETSALMGRNVAKLIVEGLQNGY